MESIRAARSPETQKKLDVALAQKEFIEKLGSYFPDGITEKDYQGFTDEAGLPLTAEAVLHERLRDLRHICEVGALLGPGVSFENYLESYLRSIRDDQDFIRNERERLELVIDQLVAGN